MAGRETQNTWTKKRHCSSKPQTFAWGSVTPSNYMCLWWDMSFLQSKYEQFQLVPTFILLHRMSRPFISKLLLYIYVLKMGINLRWINTALFNKDDNKPVVSELRSYRRRRSSSTFCLILKLLSLVKTQKNYFLQTCP